MLSFILYHFHALHWHAFESFLTKTAGSSNCDSLLDTGVAAYWSFVCWFQKSVLVYEIYDDGAIAKDDRLLSGDQILEVGLNLLIPFDTRVSNSAGPVMFNEEIWLFWHCWLEKIKKISATIMSEKFTFEVIPEKMWHCISDVFFQKEKGSLTTHSFTTFQLIFLKLITLQHVLETTPHEKCG